VIGFGGEGTVLLSPSVGRNVNGIPNTLTYSALSMGQKELHYMNYLLYLIPKSPDFLAQDVSATGLS
jgi:hypothetical protein